MKTTNLLVFLISLLTCTAWSQTTRLNVAGNAEISGNLTTNSLAASSGVFSGNSALRVSTTATSVLDLRASNPLVEFRDNTPTATYLGFIQFFGTDFYFSNRQAGNMFFRTANLNRMTITAEGNVGIGTTSPASKLTVNGTENDGVTAGIEVLSGSQKLIMDGNEIDCINADLHLNFNSQNDLLVRTTERLAEVTISHGNGSGLANGVSFEHPGTNNEYWTWYVTNGDGALELYNKGIQRGEFNAANGAYTTFSDRRMKKDIQPLTGVLEKVSRLQPSTYAFRSDALSRPQLGFIAQEVQPLFPELVSQSKVGDTDEELYMINYSGFGVIAIAAIQELLAQEKKETSQLRAENREMKNQIDQLADRLADLEGRLSACCRAEEEQSGLLPENQAAPIADRPFLAQNAPNPFRAETVIQYYLPDAAKRAEIQVFDAAGQKVRTLPIEYQGYGKLTIEAGILTAGTYSYALVIDGAIWQSLPMVVTK
jgi:hypothetical protein